MKKKFEGMGHRFYSISGKTGEGVKELIEAITQMLD
jgi:hypothetical protein